MAISRVRQIKNGKAFKYAVFLKGVEYLDKNGKKTDIEFCEDEDAKTCYYSLNADMQVRFEAAAAEAIEAITSVSPNLSGNELLERIKPIHTSPFDLDYIIFEGKEYPCISIWYWKSWMLVATTYLEDKLLIDRTKYVSREAEWVDEKIFYFVEPEEIFYTKRTIWNIIRNSIGE